MNVQPLISHIYNRKNLVLQLQFLLQLDQLLSLQFTEFTDYSLQLILIQLTVSYSACYS